MILALALLAALPQQESATFHQITIHIPEDATDDQRGAQVRDFTAATRTITSCDQTAGVASQVEGKLMIVENFRLSGLPRELFDQLAGKSAGTVSQVFGQRPDYRVLIRC